MNDSFYELHYEKGIPFYVRNTNLLRDMPAYKKKVDDESEQQTLKINKMLDIPDEELIEHTIKRESAMLKLGRDQNYEEFKAQYSKHIEGKIDPSLRVGERPSTTPYDANKAKMRSTRMSMMGHSTQADTDRDRRSVMRNTWQGDDDDLDSQPRYQIPGSCKLEILKLNKVDKLDEDYVLAAHPYP